MLHVVLDVCSAASRGAAAITEVGGIMQYWPIVTLVASAVSLAPPAFSKPLPLTPLQLAAVAEEAFIYGYPRVLMAVTEQQLTGAPASSWLGPFVNRFQHQDHVPTDADRVVVRPDTDILYSSAWLDLSSEPILLHVPETQGRYYVMPLMDAWTNVLAVAGTRTTGSDAQDFAILGPSWSGALPPGIVSVRAPTNTAWILGRTLLFGPDDLPAARAVQQQYTLTPLSAWPSPPPSPPPPETPSGKIMQTPPAEVAQMDGLTFLRALADRMSTDPMPARDTSLLSLLGTIGFSPSSGEFTPAPGVAGLLDAAKAQAAARVAEVARYLGAGVHGWRVVLQGIGDYGTDYPTRAAIAFVGLGANLPADAVYPTTFVDGAGQPLTGDRSYVLHFEGGKLPPVNGFWSLTLYDDDGYLVPNPIERHALRDRDPLQLNSDGSLDLYIQSASPGSAREPNWLPSPAGATFNLTLRLYWPRPAVLHGAWSPPPVQAIPSLD